MLIAIRPPRPWKVSPPSVERWMLPYDVPSQMSVPSVQSDDGSLVPSVLAMTVVKVAPPSALRSRPRFGPPTSTTSAETPQTTQKSP